VWLGTYSIAKVALSRASESHSEAHAQVQGVLDEYSTTCVEQQFETWFGLAFRNVWQCR
jgi:hypothetical protein